MKTFDDAIEKVMDIAKDSQEFWVFTQEVIDHPRLQFCYHNAILKEPLTGDLPEEIQRFIVAALLSSFEMGLMTGIEMERREFDDGSDQA